MDGADKSFEQTLNSNQYYDVPVGELGILVSIEQKHDNLPIGVFGIAILGVNLACDEVSDGSVTFTPNIYNQIEYVWCTTETMPLTVESSKGCTYTIESIETPDLGISDGDNLASFDFDS